MGSFRAALERCSVRDGVVAPRWFGAHDHPRIAEMLAVYHGCVGARRRELGERIGAVTRGQDADLAKQVLDALFSSQVVAAIEPRRARAAVFAAAAALQARGRDPAIARAAVELGVAAEAVEEALFADLADERRVRAPGLAVTSNDVALRCNLAIAQAALASSSSVRIELEGHARAVIRHARLRGLICTAARGGAGTVVEVSGPLALFRRTALYGRHLAELLPLLAWSRAFRLEAECVVPRGEGKLVLDPSAPLLPSAPPRPFDSKLEERFARDFLRLTSEWSLVREPEPVSAEGTLIFPDFALVHHRDPTRRFLLEILGFWTADYVATKLRRLCAASLSNLILCIDERRDCGRHALPPDARVLRFEKRVDAARVLELVQEHSPGWRPFAG